MRTTTNHSTKEKTMNTTIPASNITAVGVLNEALHVLWDGIDQNEYFDDTKEKFGCHTITRGFLKLSGEVYNAHSAVFWKKFNAAEREPIVQELHKEISKYIGFFALASTFLERQLGRYPSDEEAQTFRKKMLEDILAKYEAKATDTTAVALLKSALENHLAEDTDHEGKTVYACHAVAWAACDLLGIRLFELHPTVQVLKDDIKQYIKGYKSVEDYFAAEGIKEDTYEFRQRMLKELIERYQAKLERAN
jgi:hypothetical protein